MENKYNMTIEQNVFVAKRNIVDYIWKSANIEGINITFPETQVIYDGGNIAHLRVDEIVTINNLKHAWQFILNTLNSKLDFNYLCSINSLVGSNLIENAGKLRYGDVRIGGTDWKPELPSKDEIEKNIEKYKKIENATERSISIMCYLMRTQAFWDGNKRTAMLFANAEMIKNGAGIISVSGNQKTEFGELLTEFYETNNMEKLKNWIYNNAIDGIMFES
ncbi:MAG: Fic family protein [Clostridia bacterium]|nr:Fic family protein [Clostridia bacterium]